MKVSQVSEFKGYCVLGYPKKRNDLFSNHYLILKMFIKMFKVGFFDPIGIA